MSGLISGKEALIAFANGEKVEYFDTREAFKELGWVCVSGMQAWLFLDDASKYYKFRIKPHTITLNGIEVPAPFEPKEGEECCYLSDDSKDGYHTIDYNSARYSGMVFGLYRPCDIKQVVDALRSIFK